MSVSDIKYNLRKFEYPACAKEALVKLEQLLTGRSAPSNKQLDISMDVISEFIFCESDRRGSRRGAILNPLQELQLIDVMSEYFSSNISETVKNTIFLSLFAGTESQRRLKILSILASMAVSALNTPILLAVGVWLQQTGCSSNQSLQLVESVIRDHFYLNTSNQLSLKGLANTAPQFVANFMTAVTELYMHDVQGKRKMPPKNLLEVITFWVYSTPSLCTSAQFSTTALPNGAIPMAVVAPLAGLVRWCALATLYSEQDTEMNEPVIKKIKLEDEQPFAKQLPPVILTESELYIKLHLGVLQSLRAARKAHGPPTAVNAQHLSSLIHNVQAYTQTIVASGGDLKTHAQLQDCLDRIGQSVQVALANGCVYGNINSLLATLETLPENRLLKLIIKTHQQAM